MSSLLNKQLLLTAYAYLFIMEQQKELRGSDALNIKRGHACFKADNVEQTTIEKKQQQPQSVENQAAESQGVDDEEIQPPTKVTIEKQQQQPEGVENQAAESQGVDDEEIQPPTEVHDFRDAWGPKFSEEGTRNKGTGLQESQAMEEASLELARILQEEEYQHNGGAAVRNLRVEGGNPPIVAQQEEMVNERRTQESPQKNNIASIQQQQVNEKHTQQASQLNKIPLLVKETQENIRSIQQQQAKAHLQLASLVRESLNNYKIEITGYGLRLTATEIEAEIKGYLDEWDTRRKTPQELGETIDDLVRVAYAKGSAEQYAKNEITYNKLKVALEDSLIRQLGPTSRFGMEYGQNAK